MLFSKSSLLTGVEASAAQNLPVTKTCSQCGAVLPSSVRACNFCDSSFSIGPSSWEDPQGISAPEEFAADAVLGLAGTARSRHSTAVSRKIDRNSASRAELAQQLDAYHTPRLNPLPPPPHSQF